MCMGRWCVACWRKCVLIAIALSPAAAGRADEAAVDFGRDVYPVLRKVCVECHGAEKQRGDLRLDSRTAALRGGENGPAIVVGKPEQSELVSRIMLAAGAEGVMPARGERLSDRQI